MVAHKISTTLLCRVLTTISFMICLLAFQNDANAQVANQINVRKSEFINRIIAQPLQSKLPNINIPALVIGGNYDFVVPEGALQEQFDLYGSEDKSIVILSRSSHLVISEEVGLLLENVLGFLERH